MYHVQKLSRTALWLKNGCVEHYGHAPEVCQAYLAYHEEKSAGAKKPIAAPKASAEGYYAIRSLTVDPPGRIAAGATLGVRGEVFSPDDRVPVILIGLVRADGTPVYGVATDMDGVAPTRLRAQSFAFSLTFPQLPLLPGKYLVRAHALDPDAARAAGEKAVALAPREPEAHFRIGDLERRGGDHEAAIVAYRAALATGSRHPVLLNNLGLSLQAQGRLDDAARCFREAVEAQPTLAQGHANLGDVLRLLHRFADALAAYTRALELSPGVVQIWLNRGVCQHRTGAFDAARESFERALALEPEDPDTLGNLAASLTAEGQYAEALPLLRKALQ